MLKGHVFKKQLFSSRVFAVFVDTFLAKKVGVFGNYKSKMNLSYSSNSVTVESGVLCIGGRFLEEDTFSVIETGTNEAYCKLVVEVDMDKENSKTDFAQAKYKILKSSSKYPDLIQEDIVNNDAGKYQYELARFKTGINGITDFEDTRTYIDYDSMLTYIEKRIDAIEDESIYVLKRNLEPMIEELKEKSQTKEHPEPLASNGSTLIYHRILSHEKLVYLFCELKCSVEANEKKIVCSILPSIAQSRTIHVLARVGFVDGTSSMEILELNKGNLLIQKMPKKVVEVCVDTSYILL